MEHDSCNVLYLMNLVNVLVLKYEGLAKKKKYFTIEAKVASKLG